MLRGVNLQCDVSMPGQIQHPQTAEFDSHNVQIICTLKMNMAISVAQSRQQLSALIAAAQHQPQVITNRNTPVAVLVSADYFARSEAAVKPATEGFYSQLLPLREAIAPQDDIGLTGPEQAPRAAAWQRTNAFTDSV
ncbi:MAG: hypothetical protein COW02_08555 [Comamonadaceae bacterium CG12_big_fil_rev_8_21_14_0_65_59_15]|nr:MAG: hypothetical protein COW02_08555 [Comamonadaceae bacterium CG12_big_fil_rev_8_21_14_0_65_59_15]